MIVQTTRFGELDIPDEKIIHFPYGIPGFTHLRKWCLLNPENVLSLNWIQAMEDGSIALIIADPEALFQNYDVSVDARELSPIGVDPDALGEDEPQVVMRVVLSADATTGELHANLRAPLLINLKTCLGMQLPLVRCNYSIRHPVPMKKREDVGDMASPPKGKRSSDASTSV